MFGLKPSEDDVSKPVRGEKCLSCDQEFEPHDVVISLERLTSPEGEESRASA